MFEEGNLSMKKVVFLIMAVSTVLIHMCVYCAVGELLVIKVSQPFLAFYLCIININSHYVMVNISTK